MGVLYQLRYTVGPWTYPLLALLLVALAVGIVLAVRAARGRPVPPWAWLAPPAALVVLCEVAALFSVSKAMQYGRTADPEHVSGMMATSASLILESVQLGLMMAGTVLLLGAPVMALVSAVKKDEGGASWKRPLLAAGLTILAVVGVVVWNRVGGGTPLAVDMPKTVERFNAVGLVAALACIVAALRASRDRAWVHWLVPGSCLLAVAMLTLATRLQAGITLFRTIGMASAESRSMVFEGVHASRLLFENAWPLGGKLLLVVLTAALPGIVAALRQRPAIPPRAVVAGLAVVLAPCLLAAGVAGAMRPLQAFLTPVVEARELVGDDVPLPAPLDLDGAVSARAHLAVTIVDAARSCLASGDGPPWTLRPLGPFAGDRPLEGPPLSVSPILAVPGDTLAGTVAATPWAGEEDRGRTTLYLLLDESHPLPEGGVAFGRGRTTTLALVDWISHEEVASWFSFVERPRQPALALVGAADGVHVVTADGEQVLPAEASLVPVIEEHAARAGGVWRSEVWLVPGERWTVQDVVSICLTLGELAGETCVLTETSAEAWLGLQEVYTAVAAEGAPADPAPDGT